MSLSKGKLGGIAVAAVVLIAAGITIGPRYFEEQQTNALTLYGNVDIREVELAFRVPGRLEQMHFDEGDRVEAGDLVAEIDAEPFREALDVAAARVEQVEANLAKLKAGNRPQDVARARAAVSQAQAAFDNATRELERQSTLVETGASSQKARDAARTARDEASAGLDSAKQALALAKEGFRSEDIAAATADLAAANAQKAIAETQLEDTKLRAPSAGTLISRLREPGSMLGSGMPVYSLSLRDPVYIRAYVDEPHLGRLAPGDRVKITTDSSTREYEGQIGFISPRAEFTPRSVETTALRTDLVYRLRIVVDRADDALRQGMPVTVQIPLTSAGE